MKALGGPAREYDHPLPPKLPSHILLSCLVQRNGEMLGGGEEEV